MKHNISHVGDCYGCGVCAIACSKKIIQLGYNEEGFYKPFLSNVEKCSDCGLCLKVCSFVNDELAVTVGMSYSYAAWSNNEQVRYQSSSGGIGFEIGKLLISRGYKACGVRYNILLQRAEHFIAESEEDFKKSIGSKYVQSYTPYAFSQFNNSNRFFVTGTPCQIDSLRRWIRMRNIEDRFVLMDFFCHGVPSVFLWYRYVELIRKKIGDFENVAWRNKTNGWRNSYVIYAESIGDKRDIWFSSLREGDIFYKFFLGDVCLAKACYDKCKFKKENSSADLRIGDFWGNKYKNNQKGVNVLLVFSERGREVVNQLDNCTLISENLSHATEAQMKQGAEKPVLRILIIKLLMKQGMFFLAIFVLKFHIKIKQMNHRFRKLNIFFKHISLNN